MKIYLKSNDYVVDMGTNLTCFFMIDDKVVQLKLTVGEDGCLDVPDNTTKMLIPDTDASDTFINRYQSNGWEKLNDGIDTFSLFYVFVEAVQRERLARQRIQQEALSAELVKGHSFRINLFDRMRVRSQSQQVVSDVVVEKTKSSSF